jgi:hypothetical protein
MRNRTIDHIDEIRTSFFSRAPDRPDARIIRCRADSPEVRRAKQRLRTAAWRKNNDVNGRPTTEQVAKALLMSVCASPDFKKLMQEELSLVRSAINDLVDRGYRSKEIEDVMRRIRSKHVG